VQPPGLPVSCGEADVCEWEAIAMNGWMGGPVGSNIVSSFRRDLKLIIRVTPQGAFGPDYALSPILIIGAARPGPALPLLGSFWKWLILSVCH